MLLQVSIDSLVVCIFEYLAVFICLILSNKSKFILKK